MEGAQLKISLFKPFFRAPPDAVMVLTLNSSVAISALSLMSLALSLCKKSSRRLAIFP